MRNNFETVTIMLLKLAPMAEIPRPGSKSATPDRLAQSPRQPEVEIWPFSRMRSQKIVRTPRK
jgi:hypothetical protein